MCKSLLENEKVFVRGLKHIQQNFPRKTYFTSSSILASEQIFGDIADFTNFKIPRDTMLGVPSRNLDFLET